MIGPYRIDRELGRGGMGIVYLAQDTRLDRTVALKALPPEVAGDPERLERFEREAKVLASLNHPNIAAIYDVVESEGRRYLALEHVEGETLAERLSRGPLSIDESLEVCHQIATGMEAAHERGVIHRDLKPGNVMITPGDQVKIVDFGLAKGAVGPESDQIDSPTVAASSPTLTSPAYSPGTIPGVILGTAPYLSPEQARGKPVDRRTDIWSWGCILYECLTGRMAFQGETVSDTVAAILKQEPDWALVPSGTPTRVRDLLRRCLEKDPKRRLRDIGDARLTLEESSRPEGKELVRGRPIVQFRSKRAALAVGAALFALVAAGIMIGRNGGATRAERGRPQGLLNLSIPIPPGLKYEFARITPDGQTVVMLAHPSDRTGSAAPRPSIYVRRLSGRTFEALPGTENAEGYVLSPDGKSICFLRATERSSQTRIYRTDVDGKSPVTLVGDFPRGRAGWVWGEPGNLILTGESGRDYIRMPLNGTLPSRPIPLEIPGLNANLTALNGSNIPGIGVFLSAVVYDQGAYRNGIGVLDLKTGKAKLLVSTGASARFADGHLLFTRDSTLFAARFDLGKLVLKGEAFPVLTGLKTAQNRISAFGVSSDGTLVYALGGGQDSRRIAVVDRSGGVKEWPNQRRYGSLSVSPDGRSVVLHITNENLLDEIWVSSLEPPSLRRIVFESGADCYLPLWSPDGTEIAYERESRSAEDGLYVASANGGGTPRRIGSVREEWPGGYTPLSWLPDGSQVLCLARAPSRRALVLVSTRSERELPPREVAVAGATDFSSAAFSPNGRWLAYTSNEVGPFDLFLREYRSDGSVGYPVQLSSGGATSPTWSRDGNEVLYATPDAKIMAVRLRFEPKVAAVGTRHVCALDLSPSQRQFGVLADGSLLAILETEGLNDVRQIEVTLNLKDELEAKAREVRH